MSLRPPAGDSPAPVVTPAAADPKPEAESPRPPEPSLAELLAITSRAARRSLHMRLIRHGVRAGNWYVLKTLYQTDGLTQRELSQRVGMAEPSVLALLRVMEKEGLVTRQRDAIDQRKMRVCLTDAARALQAPLSEAAQSVNRVVLKDFSQAEELLLRVLLRRMEAALSADQRERTLDARSDDALDDRYF